jgi:hypothetical protein
MKLRVHYRLIAFYGWIMYLLIVNLSGGLNSNTLAKD